MGHEQLDFEFERRFLVDQMPHELIGDQNPTIIVQSYFLAADGYGLRIRLQATNCPRTLPLHMKAEDALQTFADDFDLCILTAKGPAAGGTRYEAERELDINVGLEMCLRGGKPIVKRRYGVWVDEDGWVIDQFAGQNKPLIIAECERTSPVTDLAIPSFCVVEITDDYRFSNDALANLPYGKWVADHAAERRLTADSYLQEFGENTASSF